MARITAECEARIKESADIVELIGKYLEIRRAGSAWKACCPFHHEKTPSFHINPARQTFHCFGCGVGGDALKFLMMYENLSYPDALRRMADANGVAIQEEEENPELVRMRQLRRRVVELNKLAMEHYHRLLCRSPQAAHVREYLKSRGINIEMARAWQLGWAPPHAGELVQLARQQKMNERLLVDAYLMGQGRSGLYPVFQDRLMFPIINVRGEVVGFSGRVMQEDKDPRKYVNTGDTVAFRKGELLFGLNKATAAMGREAMTAILCEGQVDVLSCHEKGELRHAVAGLGTAFTDEQAQLLRKYAKKVILCYDADNAGMKASEKSFRKLAAAGLDVYQAALPAGEDPDSLIGAQGAAALKQLVDAAVPYLEYRSEQESLRTLNTSEKAEVIAQLADLAAELPDATRRDLATVELATRMNVGLELLRTQVAEIIAERKRGKNRRSYQPKQGVTQEEQMTVVEAVRPVPLHACIRGLISLAAGNAQAQQLILDRIEDLYEPMRLLAGGEILQRLMEQLPPAGEPEAWAQFLTCLTPAQVAAIESLDLAPTQLAGAAAYVQQACERAASAGVQSLIDEKRARMHDTHASDEEKLRLMTEISELQRILNQSGLVI